MTSVEPSIAAKAGEIKSLPYAKFVVDENTIQRNFNYRIVRQEVARGKNSVIYRCEAPKHNDLFCVVKPYKFGKDRVKNSLHEETVQIMRFTSRKCAQLVNTLDVFYTNERIYMITDWSVLGDILTAIKTRRIRLNEPMLRNWALDITSALSFLHSNAICHRNVAPSCLLLAPNDRVKLTCLSDATIYTHSDGTLIKQKWAKFSRNLNWNQPPEVAKNKMYDPRKADVWSMGATIYWFIKRTHPIDYKSNSRMTTQLNDKIRMIQGKVSTKCVAWCKKVLSFQPADRPLISAVGKLEWFTGAAPAQVEEFSEKLSDKGTDTALIPDRGETGEAAGPETPESMDPAQPSEAPNNEPEPSTSVSRNLTAPSETPQ